MITYDVKRVNSDFKFIQDEIILKGSRRKILAIDNDGRVAMFKYEREEYMCSETWSEKIAFEVAKILGYECAKIELAKDSNDKIGVLNYHFSAPPLIATNTDIIAYLNENKNERNIYYMILNIKRVLDEMNRNLFKELIKIMLFDAYINRSKVVIYKEDNKTQYKHFELIEYLREEYPDYVIPEIKRLENLTDEVISELVNKIPDELLTNQHKEQIIMYLIKRRDLLLGIN